MTKVTGLHKNAVVVEDTHNDSKKAAAFVNWSLPMSDGSYVKASKGFTIFQNEKYPNKHEDMLIALAEKHGGSVEVTMKCRIVINKTKDIGELNLDDIAVNM
jgi:hypothetical protein